MTLNFLEGIYSEPLNEARNFDLVGKSTNITERIRFLVKLQRVYVWMTWLGEAMKDGVSTDMSRGAANRL